MDSKVLDIKGELNSYINPEKAQFFPRFFKTGKGEYGEGDKFIGVTVPNQRKVAKKYREVNFETVAELISSEIHEHRLTAILILTYKFQYKKSKESNDEIYRFFMKAVEGGYVNNWDLVDTGAPKISGEYLLNQDDHSKLFEFLHSGDLWKERVAIMSTYTFIKNGSFKEALEMCEYVLDHEHDLTHKASGWMLREIGKKDVEVLYRFLDSHAGKMPRTMLRYAIERLDSDMRQRYLNR